MRAAARLASAATASMVSIGNAANVDDKMSLAGNLARSMHGRIGIELPRGDHEISARFLMLQPDALQMVQQRHGRGDRIMAMRTIDRTGMTVPAHAAGIAKSLAASDPGDHRGRELLGHQRRTLARCAAPNTRGYALRSSSGRRSLIGCGSKPRSISVDSRLLPLSDRAIERQAGSSNPNAPPLPR